jgi:hypothetical protein
MANFHVYPDPQTAAKNIVSGVTETFTPIEQLTGPPHLPGDTYVKSMFIRVAVSGGSTTPTLALRASSNDPLAFVTAVSNQSRAIFRVPGDFATYVGDVFLDPQPPSPDGTQLLKIGFDAATTETWTLQITNNDGAARDFTFVVAIDDANTRQPWLDLRPVTLPGEPPETLTLSYEALINSASDRAFTITNKGTGSVTIDGFNPALPGFATNPALPVTLAPAGSTMFTLTFTAPATPPEPDGELAVTGSLTSTPVDTTATTSLGHNKQLGITATVQRLEVVLLLDDSGSMAWDAKGQTVPKDLSRWKELSDGVTQFLNALAHFEANRGKFGIACFPATNPAGFDIVTMTDITADMTEATDKVAAINPAGGTPMGDGLDHILAPATSYFGTDPLSLQADRRWLILMSDGAHNSGTHNPLEFISASAGGTAPLGGSLEDKKINMVGVAYGLPGFTDVNPDLLQKLASGSLNKTAGNLLQVQQAGITAEVLAAALRAPLKAGLTTSGSSSLDPPAVFQIGSGEVFHDALITEFDSKAVFVISWNTPDPRRLRLELQTPNCERITPENAGFGQFARVAFRVTDRSHMYLIDQDFLRGYDPGPGGGDLQGESGNGSSQPVRPRAGTWKFVVSSPPPIIIEVAGGDEGSISGGVDTEHYSYDVLLESRLRLRMTSDRGSYFAGDSITLSAHLTAAGKPVTGASVKVATTTPAQSFNNWLARLVVPADKLEQAQQILAGQDATPILVKQLAARLAGFQFDPGQHQITLHLKDPDGIGVYEATFDDTSVPEHYSFYATAVGLTEDGVGFRRESKLDTAVLVRPEPAFTALQIQQLQPGVTTVGITPRDRFGNILLVDPATADFGITVGGGQLQGALTSTLDGSYSQTVSHDPRVAPTIGLSFGGADVITPKPTPALGDLHYVDHVISFEAGLIKDANTHADPHAALGTVVGKPADTFVALGAGGRLTVAVKHRIILPSRQGADITVIVHPDADLRSYRVEVFVPGFRKWVTIGESIGVTESFSLEAKHHPFALAIRVTDTSGHFRGTDLRPLAAPGVGIRGVGVLKTTKDLPFGHDHLPPWFPWPKAGH